MLFNSHLFLFIFLPIVIIGFILCTPKSRYSYLTVSSLLFYLYSGMISLLLLIFSSLVAFAYINLICKLKFIKNYKNFHLLTACIIVILPFLLLKYFFPSIGWISKIFEINIYNEIINFTSGILLPAGISFYSFQIISSIVDKKTRDFNLSYFEYLGYVSFFPQLIAGPIVKSSKLVPQLRSLKKTRKKEYLLNDVTTGLPLIVVGLLFKTFVSDVTQSFHMNIDLNKLLFLDAIFIIFSKSFIIYGDFFGYSTIAIGLGLLFGIQLPRNFLQPYMCSNIQQFWRCWHVTLGKWFLEYIFKPIINKISYTSSVIFVFLLTGIWHGYGFSFLLWGLLHGISLVIFVKYFYTNKLSIIGTILTFIWVSLLWVLFFYSLEEAILIYSSLFNWDSFNGFHSNYFTLKKWIYLVFIFIVIFIFNDDFLYLNSRFEFEMNFKKEKLYLRLNKIKKVKDKYNYVSFSKNYLFLINFRNMISKFIIRFLQSPILIPLLLYLSVLFFSYSNTFIYFNF